MSPMIPVYQDFGPCPCGEPNCPWGDKIKRKTGHLVGCICLSCRNAENRRTGRKAHERMHTNLGGTGKPPQHEESARPYHVSLDVLEVTVMPESKEGDQVPAGFSTFIESEWWRRAISQANRARPVGSGGVVPAVVIDGRYIVADLQPDERRW